MEEVLGTAMASASFVAVVWIMAGAYRSRLAFHQRKLEIAAGQANGSMARDNAQFVGRQSELENRVRVLERIITDGGSGHDIALQIEALRDRPQLQVTTQ